MGFWITYDIANKPTTRMVRARPGEEARPVQVQTPVLFIRVVQSGDRPGNACLGPFAYEAEADKAARKHLHDIGGEMGLPDEQVYVGRA